MFGLCMDISMIQLYIDIDNSVTDICIITFGYL